MTNDSPAASDDGWRFCLRTSPSVRRAFWKMCARISIVKWPGRRMCKWSSNGYCVFTRPDRERKSVQAKPGEKRTEVQPRLFRLIRYIAEIYQARGEMSIFPTNYFSNIAVHVRAVFNGRYNWVASFEHGVNSNCRDCPLGKKRVTLQLDYFDSTRILDYVYHYKIELVLCRVDAVSVENEVPAGILLKWVALLRHGQSCRQWNFSDSSDFATATFCLGNEEKNW